MESPTKIFKKRKCDDFGCGYFGAPRGDHKHKGQDIVTKVGEDIYSPINGKIKKQGYTYNDDLSYRYVRVENKEYRVDLYYTTLNGYNVGDDVTIFDAIAIAQDISKRYSTNDKKMTNHTHMQVWNKRNEKWVLIDPLTVLEL